MTIFSGLVAVLGRLLGDVATATVGWATILLYGRVPQARQRLLSAVALGSLIWIIALVAVVVPSIGGAILASVPRPGSVAVDQLRIVLVAIVVILPALVGLATVLAADPDARPKGPAAAAMLIRGYPITAVLGGTIIFLAVVGLIRQARAVQKGWVVEHIPVIVKPGRYDAVGNDIESALRDAGLEVARKPAPRSVEVPPRLLLAATGRGDAHDLPDRLVAFDADDLGIILYPSDVLILGSDRSVARARTAIARRLAFADVYLTTAEESERIEDRLVEIAHQRHVTASDFRPIDDSLTRLAVPYPDWETIYRLRLQVEHETRLAGATGPGDGS